MGKLTNLSTRLNYNGGVDQRTRMEKHKEWTLLKAIEASYPPVTAKLEDGRRFRCIINPDKLKATYDDKIIAIPFRTKQHEGSGEVEDVGMKEGDTFTWEETNTKWMVFLQRFEETAYFNAEVRRCRFEVKIGEKMYPVYTRGPLENTIEWVSKGGMIFNKLNYHILMMVTKNSDTEAFFKRFQKVEFNGQPYEVQAADTISTPNIISVYLKEDFDANLVPEDPVIAPVAIDTTKPYISGQEKVYPFDLKVYAVHNINDGLWSIPESTARIVRDNGDRVAVEVLSSRSGTFTLIYKSPSLNEPLVFPVQILSL